MSGRGFVQFGGNARSPAAEDRPKLRYDCQKDIKDGACGLPRDDLVEASSREASSQSREQTKLCSWEALGVHGNIVAEGNDTCLLS